MQPYYAAGGIALYHGDCLDVMPQLEAQSFDAIITDVPYGTTACAWDSPIPFAPMWECLKRLAKPRAAIVLFGSQPFTSALIASRFDWFRYEWVWDKVNRKTGSLTVEYMPMKRHENILVFGKTAPLFNKQMIKRAPAVGGHRSDHGKHLRHIDRQHNIRGDETHPDSVLEIPAAGSNNWGLHPTQKPLALMEYLIKTYTNEGDTILDFTCGSGTTLRAAKNLKRKAVGIERELHYCEVTVKRLEPTFEAALVDDTTDLADLPLFS